MKTARRILIAIWILAGNVAWGQDLSQQITLPGEDIALGKLLEVITQTSDIPFSYNPRRIPLDKKLTFTQDAASIKTLLDQVQAATGVRYHLMAGTIILKASEKVDSGYKSPSHSQNTLRTLQGKVIDKDTGEPLGFANLRLKGSSLGMVSNEAGEFDMRVPAKGNFKSLLVSYIGYKNQEIPLNTFQNSRLHIALEENALNLAEVEINPVEPLDVLTDALAQIKANYTTEPFAYEAYYRELVKVDTSFVKFADAATYVYNPGYTQKSDDDPVPNYAFEEEALPFPHEPMTYTSRISSDVKVLEARASDNLQRTQKMVGAIDFERFSITDGIQTLIVYDYAQTPLQFLRKDRWNSFEFTMEDQVYVNDRPAYVIAFTPKGKSIKKALVSGKVFIDIRSSAIVAYEFEVPERLQSKLEKKTGWIKFIANVSQKYRAQFEGRSRFRRKMSDYNHKVAVQFQEFQGKWYLAQIKEVSFYHNTGDILDDMYFETNKELVVNRVVNRNATTIPRKERFSGQLFSYPTEYNPDFWASYNAVKPTGVFGKALGDLEKDKSLDAQFRSRVTKDTTLQPPIAQKVPTERTIHGHTLQDAYRWLQNPYSAEASQYIFDENAYTANYMIPLKKLTRNLYREMVDRVKKNDESVPVKIDDYYYYVRYADSLDYPVFARKYQSLEAEEEIIQDVNLLAEGYEYYSLSPGSPSPDHNIFPLYENLTGGFDNILRFKDLQQNAFIQDTLLDVFSMVWFESGDAFLYTRQEEKSKRSYQVYLHVLGTPQSNDQLIFEEPDATFHIDLTKSTSNGFLFIHSSSKNESEVYMLDARQANTKKTLIQAREAGHTYYVDHLRDTFFFMSNQNAPNFQLLASPVNNWNMDNWEVLIPHQDEAMLVDFQLFDHHVVYLEMRNAQHYLKVLDLRSGKPHTLKFGRQIHMLGLGSNPDPSSDSFIFEYEDPITPPIVYRYTFDSQERSVVKQTQVQSPYDPKEYKMERIFALSHDGQQIPITLIYRKGATKSRVYKVNGEKTARQRRMYLTSYGAYGISSAPYFSFARLSLLDRGVICAIAHIRGGRELGERWYQEGKLLHKKNSFKDFISVAEHLIAENYIEKGRIAISGGSAGGLLVGAVVNERPDLFHSAILNVPFLDVMNTMLNEDLPLTSGEYKEWGNPREKEYFDYMRSYAPYENIKAQDYPHMLFTCAINDDNVPYWEAVKMVAKLRDLKTDEHEILLKVNTSGGHGGGSRRFDGFWELAREYAFILDLF
ncbi:MAG: prolyl oligopeptidase family serine peptidase [Bacteroidota bacterium]